MSYRVTSCETGIAGEIDLVGKNIEVNISNKTFEQKVRKQHFIYTTIRVYKRLRWAGGASVKVHTA